MNHKTGTYYHCTKILYAYPFHISSITMAALGNGGNPNGGRSKMTLEAALHHPEPMHLDENGPDISFSQSKSQRHCKSFAHLLPSHRTSDGKA